jgi:hypothetical protein
MKETTFIIKKLDFGWYWQDIVNEYDAHTYCAEELEVPQEWIEEVECFERAFKLSLYRSRSYFNEDWYVNLRRIECQSA